MADALLGVVVENLFSLIQNEFATLSGVKQEAEKLSRTLDLIKAVVEDAEKKQITDGSIKTWLQQLKDAAYALDDILDECSIKSHRLGGLSSFNPKNIKFRHGIGNRLKEIAGRLDEIAKNKVMLLLQPAPAPGITERPTEVPEWRVTSSIIDQRLRRVYERDEDKKKIVEFLISHARASDVLSVYPIVGLGGMGKTTLAQLVYNDDRVSSHFDIKIWICVSENFAVKRILCSIIESITEKEYNILEFNIMGKKVQELLRGQKYLLVLDDVWSTNQEFKYGLSPEKWNDQLKSVLACGTKEASILVSTRDKDVAAIMGTCPAHHLSGLSDDACLSLFKQCAFVGDNKERPELVAIGKEIVKKCRGSPLAAEALGGLLCSKSEEKEWLEVKDSELWSLPDERRILPALRLSYFHLTPTLKQCFAFCAIFPKDTEIMKEDLIHLWMAHGFISSRTHLDVEDVGNMIWNELCQKSFFQDITTNENGVIFFKMHDLVHDLAQSIMGQECTILENDANMADLSRSTHHIGFGSSGGVSSFNKKAFEKVESLRTVYQLDLHCTRHSGCFVTNRSLRVLRTSSSYFELSSLENLIHLRYLELDGFAVETLPSSISKLRKLEILKLTNLFQLRCLPKDLSCLQNLRHLKISGCFELESFPEHMEGLCSLRTLTIYGCIRLRSLPEGVGHLTSLEHLQIGGCYELESFPEHMEGLRSLRTLKISKCPALRSLPEGVRHLTSLEHLEINGCSELESFPEQVMEGLRSLRTLKIECCRGLRSLPEGVRHLTSLELLSIWSCDELESFPEHMEGLRSLRTLTISECRGLRSLPEGVGHLTSLQHLEISFCDEVESFPEHMEGLRSLRTLKIFECGGLRSLPEGVGHLTSLEHLQISGCFELESFPEHMEGLRSLRTLKIAFCRGLRSLPEGVRHLTSLEHLEISACFLLESFPEHTEGLRSLRTLKISECGGLRSLPEVVRHLTSLELLSIRPCQALKKRCKEGTGEDWHKIAHIPNVELIGPESDEEAESP